jgi:hypothetical protein
MEGTRAVGRMPFKPQTVLLCWRPSVRVGRFIRRSSLEMYIGALLRRWFWVRVPVNPDRLEQPFSLEISLKRTSDQHPAVAH